MDQVDEETASGRSIGAASYLTAVNQLLVNVQPVLFGALAVQIGLDEAQIGLLASVLIATSTLAAISGPLWVRRVDWRRVSIISLVCVTAAYLGGAWLGSFAGALLLLAAIGAFLGILAPPAFGCLGDAEDSGRAFAISVVFQSALAASASLALALVIIPRFSAPGAFVMMAVLAAVALPLCRFLPRGHRADAEQVDSSPGAPLLSAAALPAYAMLAAKGIFIAGILGYWIFVERIGIAHGIPGQLIGLTVGLCAFASVAGAAIVSRLAGRVPPVVVILAGTATVLAAFFILELPGLTPFVLSNLLFAFGWGLAQPSYWTVLHTVDATKRLFVSAPAASGVGGVMVGLVAGPVIDWGGLRAMTMLSGICLLVAAAIALMLTYLAVRRARDFQPAAV